MDKKIRTISNSTSSSSRNNRTSTSTASSSTTGSSSSGSSPSSSSDSDSSTSRESSVKNASTDSDRPVAKPPSKKARILKIDRGDPSSDVMKNDDKPVKIARPRSSHSKYSTVAKSKEVLALATQSDCESDRTKPNHSEAESLSDNQEEGLAKKQTRSYSDIKSKYLTFSEESGSETKHSKVERNTLEEGSFSEVLIGEQRCPLRDCDSSGHLGGRLVKHFTKEACPMYHNQTVQECEAAFVNRRINLDGEKVLTAKPKEDGKTKELRIVLQDFLNTDNNEATRVNREPKLTGIAPEFDLHLFREAQAIASEKVERDQILPYAMGTKLIEMGRYELQVWYESPYPEDFAHAPKLYVCEFCLRYMRSGTTNRRHAIKCVWRHPPGEEIYRHNETSIWEVDGKKNREYCRNLCLFAKFFLDHKTLHDNVEPFYFYVVTRQDSDGCHAVGYFSKEKNSAMNYNVSCILTFPHYQRRGYGRLLIDFSYLLTRIEGRVGTPEKPLSDLGLISYRSYWQDVLLNYLRTFAGKELSIKDLSQETGINSYDIVSTLQALSMIKYWKGKHIILKKQDLIEEYVERFKKQGTKNKRIDSSLLKWAPRT